MEHFGDEEGDVWNNDDDHRFHRTHLRRESGRETARQTEQSPDADRSYDDDEEGYDAQHDVNGDDIVFPDLTELTEHVIKHLKRTTTRNTQRTAPSSD